MMITRCDTCGAEALADDGRALEDAGHTRRPLDPFGYYVPVEWLAAGGAMYLGEHAELDRVLVACSTKCLGEIAMRHRPLDLDASPLNAS